eukprot:TRINITY_DN9175_c1_g2_i2.p1 TRINITY_DN9175_c1_g2~~TRINITY_DN9175_c1_g2_i2.p1  ORF type:complete len:509 (+),score=75.34 TRINITY_DN9175_c1_g2_i2:108-1634(+)
MTETITATSASMMMMVVYGAPLPSIPLPSTEPIITTDNEEYHSTGEEEEEGNETTQTSVFDFSEWASAIRSNDVDRMKRIASSSSASSPSLPPSSSSSSSLSYNTSIINARDDDGYSGLIIACLRSSHEAARFLLAYGAALNVCSYDQLETPLMIAQRRGDIIMTEIIEEYIMARASPSSSSSSTSSPSAPYRFDVSPIFGESLWAKSSIHVHTDDVVDIEEGKEDDAHAVDVSFIPYWLAINDIPCYEQGEEVTIIACDEAEVASSLRDKGKAKMIASSSPSEECSICFNGGGDDGVRMASLAACGHAFCVDCLEQWILTYARMSQVPHCPFKGCKKVISYFDVQSIISKDSPLVFEMYDRAVTHLALSRAPAGTVWRWCDHCEGGSVALGADSGCVDVQCSNELCPSLSSCTICGSQPGHPGLSCKEHGRTLRQTTLRVRMEERQTDYLARRNVKPCPGCTVLIERSGGCSHMTCSRCKYQWCFVCSGPYQPGKHTYGYKHCPCAK